jgi:uncharacterized protein YfaS (alpha-2-macroglobulin family)
MIARVLLLALGVVLLEPPAPLRAQPPEPARILVFSPQGTVKGVRQVVARFSAPMVPLGDPRPATEVFEIACPEAGTARWIDSREWAYDFARDLPAGVRCTFRLRAGLAALDGRPVGGRRDFAFSTGGPAVIAALPPEGASWIDEEQAFVLVLDAVPDDASLARHLAFEVEGLAARVPARVLAGAAREEIVKASGRTLPPGPVLVAQARQRFPNGARVTLVWGRGIATDGGVATEQDQRLDFRVRPPFRLEVSCERERRDTPCLPVTPLRVVFSAPVPWTRASRLVVEGPDGRRWTPDARAAHEPLHHGVTFRGPFPERATLTVRVPADLADDAGRRAVNAASFPLAVPTAPFPPLAKFAARFGILERAHPVLPLTVRRLEAGVTAALLRVDPPRKGAVQEWLERGVATVFRVPPERGEDVLPWLRRVAAADRTRSVFAGEPGAADVRRLPLPRAGGPDDFEVVGLPLGRPGLYVVEVQSARLGASLLEPGRTMHVPTAALVTDLGVHLKWGHASALVWVTSMARGRPVGGARVTVQDCAGEVLWRGRTDADGVARPAGLPAAGEARRCERAAGGGDWSQVQALSGLDGGLLVTAQTVDDLGFTHSSWDDGIEPWRFNLPRAFAAAAIRAHAVLDRSLLRAGETVHMKHVLRSWTLGGFALPPREAWPTALSIRHLGSDQTYALPLAWEATGVAVSAWTIPAGARLGEYQVVLVGGQRRPRWPGDDAPPEHVAGSFRVEEFRLPVLRALLKPPAAPQVGVREMPLDVAVGFLAGGPARRLPVTLRAQVLARGAGPFDGFEGYTFANGGVAEGVTRRTSGEHEEGDEGEDAGTPAAVRGRPAVHQREALVLDDAGSGRVTLRDLPRSGAPREVLAEIEMRDPSGEVHTVATRVPLWPAARLAGVRAPAGAVADGTLRLRLAVVDLAGRPVAGAPVRADLFERRLYSHRKRLVGGFYAYEHVEDTRRVGPLCEGRTDAAGVLACEAPAPATGRLVVQVTATDDAGRPSTAHQDVWVVGPEAAWWFPVGDGDRMDVIPERRRYEPGERARFQVRMPFREATALVTTEREGVLDARVVRLAGAEPAVEVPLGAGAAPNVFVSVLAVRGRVGDVQPTALVDLGRPAFRLGIAEVRVGWRAHELKVSVTPAQSVYRVRERARVTVAVETADGRPLPAGAEVAVAAVDEALLELADNPSWRLLEAMLQRRGHGVATATAQMHVVGKRHFGKKALPAGGGGGRHTTRELADTLLLWNPRVPLDAAGRATLDVPLNDALTAFRIVAVATGGEGHFGTGAATIRSTQELMVLPGLPPLVREGDRFAAEVTLRNTTAAALEVTAAARVDGLGAALPPRAVRLEPGEARVVGWEVVAPIGVAGLDWEIEAAAPGGSAGAAAPGGSAGAAAPGGSAGAAAPGGSAGAAAPGGVGDRVRVRQRVVAAVPEVTLQATLARVPVPGQALRQTVEAPADAVPGRGGVRVTLGASLLAGAEPLRAWMRAYPYRCLEQEASRAVALRDAALWAAVVAALPAHLDGDGLLKYFPAMRQGSDVLTAYVVAVAHEAGLALPDGPRGRMLAGLQHLVAGRLRRGSDVPAPDLTLRKLAALEALSRHGAVEPSLVSTLTVEPNLWPTSGVLDWWAVLRRVPGLPGRAARLAEAEQILRGRVTVQGTTLGFSTETSDRLSWLMVSGDVNAARLLLGLLEAGLWRDELPRLVRGAVGRQRRGHWDLTTANAWGALALEKFARAHETAPVSGATRVALGGEARRLDWAPSSAGGTLVLGWPGGRADAPGGRADAPGGREGAPGGRGDVVVEHEGTGQPWATIETRAAVPLTAPLGTGYRVTRTVTPIEARAPGRLSAGDIVRVRLDVEAQADMAWVVLTDPVPAGASHLGRGLARESGIVTAGETTSGVAWAAFEERSFEAFRAYYRWVPKGRFAVEYTLRLNQAGRLLLPPTRVEALYAPEVFGATPNAPVEVQP